MEPRKYEVDRTSSFTSKVNDIQISVSEEPQKERTRRIVRTGIVDNAKEPEACVRMTLMHQKRHSSTEPWQDTDSFHATRLKAGEEVRMILTMGKRGGCTKPCETSKHE